MTTSNEAVLPESVIENDNRMDEMLEAFNQQLRSSKITKKALERIALTITEHPIQQSKPLSSKIEVATAQLGIDIKKLQFEMTLDFMQGEGMITIHKKELNPTEEKDVESKE